jgi:NADH:ubiquinone oxidoreductase subunit F (NADH-binding)
MTLAHTTVLQDVGIAYPGTGARLVSAGPGVEDLRTYRAGGGYQALEDPQAFLAQVETSGLRGRGGAAFPAGVKLRTVRETGTETIVVANGEEGEPASAKDRWLLRNRPHLVLDGLRLAAAVVGTTSTYLYVSDALAAERVERALTELTAVPDFGIEVTVIVVDPAYVAGEETAAVRAINGGPALPTDKPPRPFEAGVAGLPTLVSNVETLANLPLIQRLGVEAYRSVGTSRSPGTFLLTLSGPASSGLYEIPFGATLREVLTWLGQDASAVGALLVGGYFAGVVGPRALDLPLDHDSFAEAGSGLGCGAIVMLDDCPVAASAAVMAYFGRENAGQCGSCFNGTAAMAAVLEALRDQRVESDDMDRLGHWSGFLRGRGACGTLDGATNVAASLLREFPEQVAAHRNGACAVCAAATVPSYPPYAVSLAAHGREETP